jgi:hypothetical protein
VTPKAPTPPPPSTAPPTPPTPPKEGKLDPTEGEKPKNGKLEEAEEKAREAEREARKEERKQEKEQKAEEREQAREEKREEKHEQTRIDEGQSTQTQPTERPSSPQAGAAGAVINFQPQIQVQVNPQIDVDAAPTANADADANSNATATATPTATATSTIEANVVQPVASAPVLPTTPDAANSTVAETTVPAPATVRTEGPQRSDRARPGHKRKGALISGVVLFGVSYGAAAFAGYKLGQSCGQSNAFNECSTVSRNMYIPIAGPFMNLEHAERPTDKLAMAFTGGAEATGLLLAVVGAILFHRDSVKNRVITKDGFALHQRPRVSFMPGLRGNLTMRF